MFSAKCLFTLCLSFCFSLLNAADLDSDAFDWEKDLKYRLESDQPIRFWVGAKDGFIEKVVFQIHRIEDAKGFSLYKPGDTPAQNLAQLDERGHRFEFKPDLKVLAMATSYTVHFKLFGQKTIEEDDTKTIEKLSDQGKFQIHRQSHSLEVEGLPEAPVRLYRLFPTSSPAHAMTVLLRGPSDPLPPELHNSQAVYLLDAAGKKVRLIEQKQSTITLGSQQKSAPLPLSVNSLKEAGRYQVTNHLVRDHEKDPTKLEYEVIVSDPWWVPLGVIFLGVLVAYYLRYLVQRKQPALVKQASYADWTHRLQAKMGLFPNEDQLTQLWEQLQNLKLGTGNPSQETIDQTLNTMATDFDTFLDGVTERKKSLRQKLPQLKEKLRGWRASLPEAVDEDIHSPKERLFLEEAQATLEDAENLLNQDRLATAEKVFFELEYQAKSMLKVILRARLTAMQDEANGLDEERLAEMLTDLKDDLTQSLDKLDQADTDLFIILRNHYRQRATLEKCKRQNRVSLAVSDPSMNTWTEIYEGFALVIEEPAPTSAAKVLTSGRLHRVNQSIEFELVLTPEVASNTASVRWYFGDGKSITETDFTGRADHTYTAPSEAYTMTVEVFDAKHKRLFQDTLLLTISPSAEQTKAQRARDLIEGNEIAISVVALLIAAATGFWKLYLDEAFFGRPQDYLTAFLWGFGLDSSLQGLKPIAKNFRESLDKT